MSIPSMPSLKDEPCGFEQRSYLNVRTLWQRLAIAVIDEEAVQPAARPAPYPASDRRS